LRVGNPIPPVFLSGAREGKGRFQDVFRGSFNADSDASRGVSWQRVSQWKRMLDAHIDDCPSFEVEGVPLAEVAVAKDLGPFLDGMVGCAKGR
jgi:hypothetical protein